MESFNNERRVQQGEDWNLDVLLSGSNREYIPFIVPMAMQNPFFTITVGSTKFEKNYRYVETWWNEYKGPKFESTVPVFYGDIVPVAPEAIDLGERLFAPTAFNYRDYTNVDRVLINQSLTPMPVNPHAFDPTITEPNTVKVGFSNNIGEFKVDEADDPKIYWYQLTDGEYYHVSYCRVASYRGLELEINTNESALKNKIVEIGYEEGTINTDFFVDRENDSKIYKYKLTGETEYRYCYFDYEDEELKDLDVSPQVMLPPVPSTDEDDPTYDDAEHPSLYYYTVNTDEIDPELMHKPYYYFYYDYSSGHPVLRDEYECTIHQNFLTEETAKWNGQNYMYQITLVDGQLMADYLEAQRSLRESEGYDLSDYPEEAESEEELNELRYKYLKARWPNTFQADIDSDSPLGTINNIIPVMAPTKLEVFNNIRRLI